MYAWPIATISRNTRPVATASGFYPSPKPLLSGDARGIVPVHRHGHQNGQGMWYIFCLFLCLLLPWLPQGQWNIITCQMVASSSFQGSHGHAASGNAVCIAPVHRHGYRNGRRTRCLIPFVDFFTRHKRSLKTMLWSLNINPSYHIIHYYVNI